MQKLIFVSTMIIVSTLFLSRYVHSKYSIFHSHSSIFLENQRERCQIKLENIFKKEQLSSMKTFNDSKHVKQMSVYVRIPENRLFLKPAFSTLFKVYLYYKVRLRRGRVQIYWTLGN